VAREILLCEISTHSGETVLPLGANRGVPRLLVRGRGRHVLRRARARGSVPRARSPSSSKIRSSAVAAAMPRLIGQFGRSRAWGPPGWSVQLSLTTVSHLF